MCAGIIYCILAINKAEKQLSDFAVTQKPEALLDEMLPIRHITKELRRPFPNSAQMKDDEDALCILYFIRHRLLPVIEYLCYPITE